MEATLLQASYSLLSRPLNSKMNSNDAANHDLLACILLMGTYYGAFKYQDNEETTNVAYLKTPDYESGDQHSAWDGFS